MNRLPLWATGKTRMWWLLWTGALICGATFVLSVYWDFQVEAYDQRFYDGYTLLSLPARNDAWERHVADREAAGITALGWRVLVFRGRALVACALLVALATVRGVGSQTGKRRWSYAVGGLLGLAAIAVVFVMTFWWCFFGVATAG